MWNYYLGVKINNYNYVVNDYLPVNAVLSLSHNNSQLGIIVQSN